MGSKFQASSTPVYKEDHRLRTRTDDVTLTDDEKFAIWTPSSGSEPHKVL